MAAFAAASSASRVRAGCSLSRQSTTATGSSALPKAVVRSGEAGGGRSRRLSSPVGTLANSGSPSVSSTSASSLSSRRARASGDGV